MYSSGVHCYRMIHQHRRVTFTSLGGTTSNEGLRAVKGHEWTTTFMLGQRGMSLGQWILHHGREGLSVEWQIASVSHFSFHLVPWLPSPAFVFSGSLVCCVSCVLKHPGLLQIAA